MMTAGIERRPLIEKEGSTSTMGGLKCVEDAAVVVYTMFAGLFNILRKKPVVIALCFIGAVSIVFLLNQEDDRDYYIVLSSDLNLYYLVHVPFAIQAWKNLGVKTVLMLTLEPNETTNLAVDKVLDFSRTLGAHIVTIRNQSIAAGQLAQTSRSFAAGTEFAHTLDPEKTIFLTTDVDFFPSTVHHHIPSPSKEIFFYDQGCCGNIEWKGTTYEMYIMITIAMPLKRWREIIELPANEPVNSSYIEDAISKTFDYEIDSKDQWWRWFLDQRYFGYKMYSWKTNNSEEFDRISEGMPKGRRLDRKKWPNAQAFRRMDNIWDHYEAAHLTPGIIMDTIWEKNLLFYEKIFPTEQLQRLTNYRNDVVKHANVTETLRRHYHPEQNDKYWKDTFKQDGMLDKKLRKRLSR
ncbi:unnamed protein product [Bursaphelenchus okinawaensis]|uniref:Uncharacterized protein n=1 Tax=Bursaphelenchus okinawaensis TaxID=465554 RepID=A0A811KLV3_9BILA|nr:unnamed protein product [Bursaphelenchus okinawaensis]CAG9105714.1 unnamed protein product [Bursaphelenchus okinawaensis]